MPAERDCERLVYRYAWLVDSGEAAAIADLFAVDGVWAAGTGEPMRGVYLVNFRHDSRTGVAEKPAPADVPKYVGEYHLTFRRVDGTWLFHTLELDLAFIRDSRPR